LSGERKINDAVRKHGRQAVALPDGLAEHSARRQRAEIPIDGNGNERRDPAKGLNGAHGTAPFSSSSPSPAKGTVKREFAWLVGAATRKGPRDGFSDAANTAAHTRLLTPWKRRLLLEAPATTSQNAKAEN
jgi:hypothetical protein